VAIYSKTGDFLWIRVPRTGSTSFLHHLNAAFGPEDLELVGRQHSSALEAMPINCRSFGSVRNPWEWLVSFYNAGISVASSETHELWSGNLIYPPDTPGIHPGQRENATFEEWVRSEPRSTPADWLFDEAGENLLVDRVMLFEDFTRYAAVRLSAMPHAPYREWYTPSLAAYVEVKCAREIELGGYRF